MTDIGTAGYLDISFNECLTLNNGYKLIFNKDGNTSLYDHNLTTTTTLSSSLLNHKTLDITESVLLGTSSDATNIIIKIDDVNTSTPSSHLLTYDPSIMSLGLFGDKIIFSPISKYFILYTQFNVYYGSTDLVGWTPTLTNIAFETSGYYKDNYEGSNYFNNECFTYFNDEHVDLYLYHRSVTESGITLNGQKQVLTRFYFGNDKFLQLNETQHLSLSRPHKLVSFNNLESAFIRFNSEDTTIYHDIININGDGGLVVISEYNDQNDQYSFENQIRFQNNYWFYGDDNIVRYSEYNDPTYIPETNYDDFGEDIDRITGLNLAAYNVLLVYKKE